MFDANAKTGTIPTEVPQQMQKMGRLVEGISDHMNGLEERLKSVVPGGVPPSERAIRDAANTVTGGPAGATTPLSIQLLTLNSSLERIDSHILRILDTIQL